MALTSGLVLLAALAAPVDSEEEPARGALGEIVLKRGDDPAYADPDLDDADWVAFDRLPNDAWMGIDYTRASADDVLELGNFLGLQGLDRDAIASMLESRINSIQDRVGEARVPVTVVTPRRMEHR